MRRGLIASFALLVSVALASPSSGQTAPPAEDAEAIAYTKKGMAHFDRKEWQHALDALQKAFALRPRAGVMANMASCLHQLGRHDEALTTYEAVLHDFPDASEKLRTKVTNEMSTLRGKVGTLSVAGDAPPGAMLLVDKRNFGRLPLEAPVRVLAGTRVVRVEKEGYPPITVTVEVRPGETRVAELVARPKLGRLDIREMHNWVVRVEIDGKDVGVTPFSELLPVGPHRVRLHGFVDVDTLATCSASSAEAETGARVESDSRSALVTLFGVTTVSLPAEVRDASLKVDAHPSGAALWIDGSLAGRTPWEGRLALGEHRVDVRAPGFVPSRETVHLEPRRDRALTVLLEAEPSFWTGRRVGVVTAFGVGALGLGVFAVAGGLALSKSNALLSKCPNDYCPGDLKSEQDAAHSLGLAALTGAVLGTIGVGVGAAVLVFTAPEPKPKNPIATGTSLEVAMGMGALYVRGSF